ncbi:MAG: hypothetical protein NC078_02450 [Ruminococcus sp.]|nr:hypothetical protein [Ruminococcus sp.]
MIEEIYAAISKAMNEKRRLTRGAVVLIGVCSFIAGVIIGAAAARPAKGRRAAACYSCGDDFDADEYVRNLNFDEE